MTPTQNFMLSSNFALVFQNFQARKSTVCFSMLDCSFFSFFFLRVSKFPRAKWTFLARPEMPTTSEIASEIGALADVEGRVARPSAAIPPVDPKAAVALNCQARKSTFILCNT